MKKLLLTILAFAGCFFGAMAADEPQYPGGQDAMKSFIAKTLVYPEAAKENGVEGVVNVAFTVNPDGTIGAVKIVRMVDPDLEQEAIRIVKKMPKWIPADKDGQAVAATAQVAVTFELPGE